MDDDLLGLADASELLRLSPERVRQLVVAGDLPGVRFGNAWAVRRREVLARRRQVSRRGRPLSALRAWEEIVAEVGDFSNASRYRNRGEVRRYEMSSADVQHLASHDEALVSGVAAAIAYGEALSAESAGADLYVDASLARALSSLVAAVEKPFGEVVVRVVPEEVWPFVHDHRVEGAGGRHLAPRAAVALDLMESSDPRHWIAAESLGASHG